ncbi:Putative beta-lactamase/transpeptidase [Septoria linicola]|uniref:Beta-lactamase/transpeptidase n=1 Tax=Septoria linicola TaxID=215465 RepID=A0A9Q9EMZ9_9PEZI|nr:Putative beta-lactamase/transpeptidase [Septoria linicola]
MRFALAGLAFACVATTTSAQASKTAVKICPIKGQQFPIPTRLSQESLFQNVTRSIEDHIKANLTSSPYNETTFSLGLFSVDEDQLLYQYAHTDATVRNSTLGTQSADADSIYRIASISKVLTVYLWMIKEGDRRWNDPVAEHIPELAQIDRSQYDYAVPGWNEITIGDLASYLAGVARDYGLNELALQNYVTSFLPADVNKLPDNVPQSEVPVCGFLTANISYMTCTGQQSVHGIGELAASFPPGYTPLYSNANFALLGIALANLVGQSIEGIFNESLVEPLGLTGTTLSNPKSTVTRFVVPGGDEQKTGWNNTLGPQNPAAGAFSTVKDMAAIGRAILNSSLTAKSTTRRWFSSTSFVDLTDQALGRGWEIFRRQSDGHSIDIYTKSGFWGAYTSIFTLIPEYNVGFTVLTASSRAYGKVRDELPNIIVNAMLPGLDNISRQQAHRNFAGHYTLSDNSNTSIAVTTDSLPGLRLTEYISNGVDLIEAVLGKDGDFRPIPNHLYNGNKVGFTGVYQAPQKQLPDGTWYWPCQTWLDIDDFTYGNVPLGQLVFEVDESGRAGSVELKALRQKLERKQV